MIALAHPKKEVKHDTFLKMLPRIIRYASVAFQGLDAEKKEDALAEVVARCFVAYVRLVELGKEDIVYPTVLALYAIRQYRDGRRTGTKANSHDVHARREGVRVEHLGTPRDQRWRESLIDNTRSPVPDQAAFRIDFPEYLRMLCARDRRLALQLARGERTSDVALRFGISKGRVSQLRRELQEEWLRFQGELPARGEH